MAALSICNWIILQLTFTLHEDGGLSVSLVLMFVFMQVAVDIDYHRTMFDLHQRVSPKEVIIGWWVLGSIITWPHIDYLHSSGDL